MEKEFSKKFLLGKLVAKSTGSCFDLEAVVSAKIQCFSFLKLVYFPLYYYSLPFHEVANSEKLLKAANKKMWHNMHSCIVFYDLILDLTWLISFICTIFKNF